VLKRGRVSLETGLVVLALILVKLLLEELSLEFIDLSPLYTSIVAGGIFVIGLIVAGTLADYKESEKMPAEITAALENIHEDCRSIRGTTPDFDLDRLRTSLASIVAALRADLADPTSRSCLDAINDLSPSFLQLERLGVPPNYIVRLRTEQGTVRKNVLRIYHIQRIDFLPSAYLLIQTIVILIIAALEFTQIDPTHQSVVILAFISYFFVYLLRLLRIIDRPFRVDERTMDDVSLFLLNEFAGRLDQERG
jgi:hypothetical protein